jgi:hypothetical protein
MREVWKDLAQVWGKPLLDEAWNRQLIEAGQNAQWEQWVFETIPNLYGKVLGTQEQYYLWEKCARALEPMLDTQKPTDIAPLMIVKWRQNFLQIGQQIIRRIERRRREYSFHSSKGLNGIVFDEAAWLSEPPENKTESGIKQKIPTDADRWEAAKKAFYSSV